MWWLVFILCTFLSTKTNLFVLHSFMVSETNPNLPCKVDLAMDTKNSIPLTVLNVINDVTWTGGPLIRVKDQISRPTARELAGNATWLLPFVHRSPAKARFRVISQNMIHASGFVLAFGLISQNMTHAN